MSTSCSGVVKENSQLDAKLFLVAKRRLATVTAYTHFKPVMTGPAEGYADRTEERREWVWDTPTLWRQPQMHSQKINCTASKIWLVCAHRFVLSHWGRRSLVWTLTLDDVSQTLRVQQVFKASHFLFELTHQPVVGVLVDDGVAADLFGTISIPEATDCFRQCFPQKVTLSYSQNAKRNAPKSNEAP